MGRYCTWSADVLTRYARLDKRLGASGTAAQAESAFIAMAEADLDMRLAPYYATPFSSNNLTAKSLAIDLTYALAAGPDDQERAALVMARVESAIAGLAGGRMRMIISSGDTLGSAGAQTVWSPNQAYVPVFDMDSPWNWEVDSAQLYDIDVARGNVP